MGGKGWRSLFAAKLQRTFYVDSPWSEELTMKYPPVFLSGAETESSCLAIPFSGGSLERWHEMERCRGGKHHFPSGELVDVMYKRHVMLSILVTSFTNEFEKDGRFQRVQRGKRRDFLLRAISFSGRMTAERACLRIFSFWL